jgi:hypothetical protein
MELQFSENPFSEVTTFTYIKPSKSITFESSKETKELLIRRSDYILKDAIVDVI